MFEDIQHISETIGSRPPASQEEYETACYIQDKLQHLAIEAEVQPFFTISRYGLRPGLSALVAGLGFWLGLSKFRRQQRIGNVMTGWGSISIQRALRGKRFLREEFYPQRRSQNVIVRLPAASTQQHRIVLIAGMDTPPTRYSSDALVSRWRPMLFKLLSAGAWVGTFDLPVSMPKFMRRLAGLSLIASGIGVMADELNTPSPGANNNASAIALLLSLAAELKADPLPHTEVILAFTGSDTVAGRGTAELIAQYGKTWQDAWWIVLDGVGAGELCYVTEHGLGLGTAYKPHPVARKLLQQIAARCPESGLIGYPMATLDAVRPLIENRLRAVALRGYDRQTGLPVNYEQACDTPERLNPDTLSRTRQIIELLLTTVDSGEAPDD